MKKLLALLLCLTLGLPLPLLAQTFPPLSVSGPEIPGNNYDDDGDGVTDEIPATSIVEDSDAAGNYHFHFKDCEKVIFANVTDDTFPDDVRVEKPGGATIIEGEMVCYIPNLPAATYTLHLLYSTPSGTRAVWPGVNKSLRYQMKPEEASILPFVTTPQWIPLIYTGTAANYYAGVNGGDQVQFVWKGGSFALAFKSDGARYACGYLSISANPSRTCPGETPTQPVLADYEAYELGSEAVPTAYNSAAFTNANTIAFNGTETGTVCGGTLTAKLLWDNATTDRKYYSIVCNDTEAVTLTTTNDVSMAATNEDRVDIRWCTVQSGTVDTNCYFSMGNLQPVYSDGDWSGTSNARNYTVNLNTTIVRNINAGVSWNLFIATDMGANITPDSILQFAMGINDQDAAGGSFKLFKGTSITDLGQWGTVKFSATPVPASGGGTDKTAPVVTSPAIPAGTVEQTSFIMTALTDEAGTCRVHWGISAGVYTASGTGTASVNGVCTAAVGGLDPGTTYHAEMRVTDAFGNIGDSTNVETKTTGSVATNCTHYASQNGAGDGTTEAKPYKISQFWVQATPGKVLCLLDGTYTGVSNMIAPGVLAENLNGTALAPITVKALNDGMVLIDGEHSNHPLRLRNNDYFVIEGVNVKRGVQAPVALATGADKNIIRRVCAWDTVLESNNHVFSLSSNSGNLLEDVCGFGKGRKIFESFNGTGVHGPNIFRRAWGMWNQSTQGGPTLTFSIGYGGPAGQKTTCENCIGTWNAELPVQSGDEPTTIFGMGTQGNAYCVDNGFFGSIAYVRASDSLASLIGGMTREANSQPDCYTYRDVVIYIDGHTNIRPHQLLNGAGTQYFLTNSTEIGGAASSIGTDWTVTNRLTVGTVPTAPGSVNNIWNGSSSSGARVCFRYGDPSQPFQARVLTTTKLWPWPMDQRIRDALTASGRSPNTVFGGTGGTVTSLMESIFGTIPAACKS